LCLLRLYYLYKVCRCILHVEGNDREPEDEPLSLSVAVRSVATATTTTLFYAVCPCARVRTFRPDHNDTIIGSRVYGPFSKTNNMTHIQSHSFLHGTDRAACACQLNCSSFPTVADVNRHATNFCQVR